MPSSSATDEGGSASSDTTLGRAFAVALVRKEFDEISALLDPDVDFRGLTPGRAWEAPTARAFVDDVLCQWFAESDELEQAIAIESDSFADRQRVSYRFLGHNEDGPFVVEQQAPYTERDGRINWIRILCSGFRSR